MEAGGGGGTGEHVKPYSRKRKAGVSLPSTLLAVFILPAGRERERERDAGGERERERCRQRERETEREKCRQRETRERERD